MSCVVFGWLFWKAVGKSELKVIFHLICGTEHSFLFSLLKVFFLSSFSLVAVNVLRDSASISCGVLNTLNPEIYPDSVFEQDRQCTYKVALRRVRVTTVAVEKL